MCQLWCESILRRMLILGIVIDQWKRLDRLPTNNGQNAISRLIPNQQHGCSIFVILFTESPKAWSCRINNKVMMTTVSRMVAFQSYVTDDCVWFCVLWYLHFLEHSSFQAGRGRIFLTSYIFLQSQLECAPTRIFASHTFSADPRWHLQCCHRQAFHSFNK